MGLFRHSGPWVYMRRGAIPWPNELLKPLLWRWHRGKSLHWRGRVNAPEAEAQRAPVVTAHLSKASRGEASNRESSRPRLNNRAGLYRPMRAHTSTHTCTCTPRASSHSCSHTQRITSPLIRENPGRAATALCHGWASYLFLRGHCAELLTWTAGCADAQFLHPSGPPALAAGLPQPGREKGIQPAQRDHQTKD